MLYKIFPSLYFDRFTEQSQWVLDLIYRHRTNQFPLNNTLKKYLDYSVDMVDWYSTYQNKTTTFFGKIKSLIPGNSSYESRRLLNQALNMASKLHSRIISEYVLYTKTALENREFNSQRVIYKSITVNNDNNVRKKFCNSLYKEVKRPDSRVPKIKY